MVNSMHFNCHYTFVYIENIYLHYQRNLPVPVHKSPYLLQDHFNVKPVTMLLIIPQKPCQRNSMSYETIPFKIVWILRVV